MIAVVPSYYMVLFPFTLIHYAGWANFLARPMKYLHRRCRWLRFAGSGQWERATFGPLIAIVVFGRVFLLIEAFISLRSLPEGSFKTTVWEDIWPHL